MSLIYVCSAKLRKKSNSVSVGEDYFLADTHKKRRGTRHPPLCLGGSLRRWARPPAGMWFLLKIIVQAQAEHFVAAAVHVGAFDVGQSVVVVRAPGVVTVGGLEVSDINAPLRMQVYAGTEP